MSLLADIYSVLSTAAPSELQKCLQDIEVRNTNNVLRCTCIVIVGA